MAKLELTLYDKSGDMRIVKENYVSGQKLLDYLKLLDEIQKKGNKMSTTEYIVKKVEFVASLFTSENVTPEDILTGVRSWELMEVVEELLDKAMGAKGDDPKPNNSLSEKLEIGT